MMNEHELAVDTRILLERALLKESIATFGEDGFGQYGQNDMPKFFQVQRINVHLETIGGRPYVEFIIFLGGYSAEDCGHIFTDKNFLIGVKNLLEANHIDATSVCYSDIGLQPEIGVSMFASVDSLMDWA